MRTYEYSPDGRELIIRNPKIWRPWVNYISGENYGLKFSQTGGGFSVFPILEGRRITRYGDDDRSGRYVYVLDEETGEFWSVNWQPVKKNLESFECRHGLGYSAINSSRGGISHSLHVFAVQNVPVEIWTIKIENLGTRARAVSFFPFVEWFLGDNAALWDAPSWYTRTEYDPREKAITATFFNPAASGDRSEAFMKPLFDVDGYCCSKRVFCGFNGSLQEPELLLSKNFEYGMARGEETIGCFKRRVKLMPGESFEGRVVLGCSGDWVKNENLTVRIPAVSLCGKAFKEVNDFWGAVIKRNEISTPDEDFNRWINIWLKYQEYQCFRWAGLGEPNAPLMGYRDVLQHVLAMCLFAPGMARSRLIEALRYQYADGRAVRQWSRKGNHDRRDYRDSPVWIIFALCSYLKETHDFGVLEEMVPYLDGEGEDTVLAHAEKALDALFFDRGEHGLSRMGEGDWYDPLNRAGWKGRGESVWLSMALVAALKEMGELFRYMRRARDAARCDERAVETSERINEHGWDGEWYIYGYDDDGRKIGSSECEEGKIFANAQTWAIISGVADHERAKKCFAALDRHLKNIFGYSIVRPCYTLKSRSYGNVGILQSHSRAYSHVGAFKMFADCLSGRGDDAYRTFKLMDPGNPGHPPEKTLADPHIIPNGYAGVNADGAYAWVLHSGSSGAFPWILKAVIEQMLGACADYDGLRVRPSLPCSWNTASIKREFRGYVYNIVIDNSKKNPEITVNGKPLKGDLVKPGI